MGSYAECWLGDLLVASTKNDVDPGLMRLFRRSDKRILPLASADAPAQLKRRFEDRNENIDLDEIDDDPELVYYVAPVSVIKDRLNVLGYTAATARRVFDVGLTGQRAQTDAWQKSWEEKEPSATRDLLRDSYRSEQVVLSGLSVDVWLATTREILSSGTEDPGAGDEGRVRSTEVTGQEWYEGPLKGTLPGYMLSHEWFGFPSPDTAAALRLTLEVYPEADELIYDVTDLVWSEYASRDDDFVGYTTDISVEEMQSMAKVILLTEGSSDAAILRASLDLLYPHLADYYSFMEFDAHDHPLRSGPREQGISRRGAVQDAAIEQAPEDVLALPAAIQPVTVLIEVGLQVTRADAVEDVERPALEVGEHDVRPGKPRVDVSA